MADDVTASQIVAGVLAAAVLAAIGPRDEGRAARVDELVGALGYLTEHPTDLPSVLTVLRELAP